jgi:hypothetical protein
VILTAVFAGRIGRRCGAVLLQAAMSWAAASGSFCQIPPWPEASQIPHQGAGHDGTPWAEREAGPG